VDVDDGGFLDAFTEHLDRLHNLARSMTSCPQDAEDLVSETCLLALRGWRRCPPEDAGAWFATVCLNAARSSYRRQSVRPTEVRAEQWLLDLTHDGVDTAGAALTAVDAHAVRDAVRRLPAPQMEAIALMDLAGYTAADRPYPRRAAGHRPVTRPPRSQGAGPVAGLPTRRTHRMTHDAERNAGRFLGGDMAPAEREAFGGHLLRCADCWTEVEQGRRGRSLAESTRTAAPAALRDHVRALVESEPEQPVPLRRRRLLLPLGVPVAAAAAVALILGLGGGTTDPPPLRLAVGDFRAERLPGTQLPDTGAPDLSQLDLQPVGAGGGSYAGLDVDGYAHRDQAGRRVVLYLSDAAFPEAPGARLLAGPDGPWVAQRGDLTILCARVPHALLVVGQDAQLVRSTATALGVL
jgi:RNA polymerase sigma factor (sigma-70 family)